MSSIAVIDKAKSTDIWVFAAKNFGVNKLAALKIKANKVRVICQQVFTSFGPGIWKKLWIGAAKNVFQTISLGYKRLEFQNAVLKNSKMSLWNLLIEKKITEIATKK